jgi:hypothetical protein
LGERRVLGDRLQERAQAGTVALLEVALGAARRRHEPREKRRRRVLEQRDEALLLVGEVLVERRFGHARLAADRLRAGLRVADVGEHRRRGIEQALLLDLEAHLQRRGMAPTRDRLSGRDDLGRHHERQSR